MTDTKLSAYEAMAKLKLTAEERTWTEAVFVSLQERFAALESIDTENTAPLISVLDMENVFREDIAVQLVPRDELLEGAPEDYDGYWQVPKTLD